MSDGPWEQHVKELTGLREAGEALARKEFDDYVDVVWWVMHCSYGSHDLLKMNELSFLASEEQYSLAWEWAKSPGGVYGEGQNCEAILECELRAESLQYSEKDHEFWHNSPKPSGASGEY